MTAEIDMLIAAQDRQAELLAEASARRLTRITDPQPVGPVPATRRRLSTVLRRIPGAPTFA
jgi:hypothetical protein